MDIANPDAALGRVVRERIAELRLWRRWYAVQPNPDTWADIAEMHRSELRALLRLLRESRRRSVADRGALAAGDFYAGMTA